MRSKAWLSLGANLGDPKAQLIEAISRLDAHPHIGVLARSTVSTTKAWGKTDQPDFANMAIAVETDLKPMQLLEICLGIEVEMGRIRREVWGPRLIDIDMIAFDDYVIHTARLTLPHPYAHSRDFVLEPLREIAPDIADWVVQVANRPR